MNIRRYFLLVCAMASGLMADAQRTISLWGDWQFREGGATLPTVFDDHVTLPGSMLTNG